MRLIVTILAVLLLAVGYRLWLSDDGLREVWRLEKAVEAQQAENEALARRNRQLRAEVEDMEQGTEAIEERARSELGMVREDEVFYQVVDDPSEPAEGSDGTP